MRLVTVLFSIAFAIAAGNNPCPFENGVFNYHNTVGIPEAERIRKIENKIVENGQKVAGGSTTLIGSIPYQAGLILNINVVRNSVCGGTIISDSKILTAAHCQNDGVNTVQSITVVLGSNLLFSGGTRVTASGVVTHPGYNPWIVANDVAVVRVPMITFSNSIQPVNLPSGTELSNNFVGTRAVASGYGITRDGESIGLLQLLSSVTLQVISNTDCQRNYGNIVQNHHLCTSGADSVGVCGGDTGGPLVATINTRRVLIGISSFIPTAGCESGSPSGFSRVTSFMPWIISV